MNRTSSLSCQSSLTPATAVNGVSSSSSSSNSQFKHTILWNNIIQNLKKNLLNDQSGESGQPLPYSNRLRKQHSRFVTGGMLLIKQNLLSSNGCSPNSSCLDNICFTGSHCVDIVYNYLTSKEQIGNFERQITREKVTKVSRSHLIRFNHKRKPNFNFI